MSISLGFPHGFEEAAAHLFGIPYRHEHGASELGDKAGCRSDSPHSVKNAPSKCVSARIRARSRGVCFQGSQESGTATGGVSSQLCHGRLEPSTDRSAYLHVKIRPRPRPLNASRCSCDTASNNSTDLNHELSPLTVMG